MRRVFCLFVLLFLAVIPSAQAQSPAPTADPIPTVLRDWRGWVLKDLEYLKGFLVSVEKKLGNERFVQNAKAEVIDAERKKQSDALAKIQTLEESLKSLN